MTGILDTLVPEFIRERAAARERERRHEFDTATTQTGRLLAMGVLTTCDDEMDRAYRWQWEQDTAKATGLSVVQVRERGERERAEVELINQLGTVWAEGETSGEYEERKAEILPFIKGIRTYDRNGRPLACKHNSTRKERGWTGFGPADGGGQRWQCLRCGAEAVVPDRSEPSPAALSARATLRQIANDALAQNRLARVAWVASLIVKLPNTVQLTSADRAEHDAWTRVAVAA